MAQFFLWILTGQIQVFSRAFFFSEGSEDESTSKFIQVVDRIQFHAVLVLEFYFFDGCQMEIVLSL